MLQPSKTLSMLDLEDIPTFSVQVGQIYPALALYSTPHLTAKTWEPEKQIESDFLLHCYNLTQRQLHILVQISLVYEAQEFLRPGQRKSSPPLPCHKKFFHA